MQFHIDVTSLTALFSLTFCYDAFIYMQLFSSRSFALSIFVSSQLGKDRKNLYLLKAQILPIYQFTHLHIYEFTCARSSRSSPVAPTDKAKSEKRKVSLILWVATTRLELFLFFSVCLLRF